ncbi:MAG TPA: hypothetical protein VE093_41380 [Polyangiaceae bacterium]|nr:hypothetical protein [Polyangiaceae bacterium]
MKRASPLVSGLGFVHDPDHYSFVRRATSNGFATLNIDRIGVGARSGHNLNLQRNAPQAFDTILAWLDQRFPPPSE